MNIKPAISCSGDKIPVSQYGLFREVLSDCNGEIEHVYTTRDDGMVNVSFHFDYMLDYNEWSRRWQLTTTPVHEIRRDAEWRVALRRLRLGFIEKQILTKGAK